MDAHWPCVAGTQVCVCMCVCGGGVGGGAGSIISFCYQGNQIYSWLQVKLSGGAKHARQCAETYANIEHMLTPAYFAVWLPAREGGSFAPDLMGEICCISNALKRVSPPHKLVLQVRGKQVFSPQQQPAGEDKLLHSASLCCVSHFSVTAAVSTPLNHHHPRCKPPGCEPQQPTLVSTPTGEIQSTLTHRAFLPTSAWINRGGRRR